MTNLDHVDSDPSTPSPDPLTVFLENHRRSLPKNRGIKRFNAGEHAWLASHGADSACDALLKKRGIPVDKNLFRSIPRRTGREELHYGELVALSGDFYESPEALFDEKPSPFPWLWEDNDLSGLREIFEKELEWIKKQGQGQLGVSYPDENIRLAWNAKAYVELALRNTDHFGWHNVCCYIQHHATALNLAASASGKEDANFHRALYTSAFADHFLTDGFAAGHIRVPRDEICTWADAHGLSGNVAGALSKLLHDQDGHVNLESLHGAGVISHRWSDDGLLVQDSTGMSWRTFCDGQLFLHSSQGQCAAVDRAVGAVSASLFEFLLAWKRRELPTGIFEATRYVPFPHAETPTLIQKFPSDIPDAQLDKLWASVGWYAKVPWIAGLERKHLRMLLKALPQIMADFRAHIAMAVENEISGRIAPEYIAAYKQIA